MTQRPEPTANIVANDTQKMRSDVVYGSDSSDTSISTMAVRGSSAGSYASSVDSVGYTLAEEEESDTSTSRPPTVIERAQAYNPIPIQSANIQNPFENIPSPPPVQRRRPPDPKEVPLPPLNMLPIQTQKEMLEAYPQYYASDYGRGDTNPNPFACQGRWAAGR